MPTEEELKAFHSSLYYHGTRYVSPDVALYQGLNPAKNGKLFITQHRHIAAGYAALGRDRDKPTKWKRNSHGWVYGFPKPKKFIGSEDQMNKKGARVLGLYTTDTIYPTHVAKAWGIPLKAKQGHTTETPIGLRRYTAEREDRPLSKRKKL